MSDCFYQVESNLIKQSLDEWGRGGRLGLRLLNPSSLGISASEPALTHLYSGDSFIPWGPKG